MNESVMKLAQRAMSVPCGGKHPFVNARDEFIVNENINAYFSLKDVKTELEFKEKVALELCYYCADNHWDRYWSSRLLTWINFVLGSDLSKDDMTDIYMFLSPLGGRVPELGREFVESGYDRSVIQKAKEQYRQGGGK
jgi:hypothetical protein